MQQKIKDELKKAMLEKNMDRVGVMRGINAAFTNELVVQGRPPTEILTENDCLKVIKKEIKKRKDSIEQFTAAGRTDLSESETMEMNILQEFVPAQMSREEIKNKISQKLSESPIDVSKKAQFIGQMMKEFGGQADGSLVKEIIDELLK